MLSSFKTVFCRFSSSKVPPTLLQLATIRCLAVITTTIFSSEMNDYWFNCAANLRYKTTDFLTHAMQKASDDISVVTSRNKTTNA